MADVEISDGGWRRSTYKRGRRHGLDRQFAGQYPSTSSLVRIAHYENDQLRSGSTVWKCLPGGAHVTGPVDAESEEFNGNNVTYVYPDLKTVISGRFVDGRLVGGYKYNLADATYDEDTFMMKLLISDTKSGPRIKYDMSSGIKISSLPLEPDFWEREMVYVKSSGLDNAGEGLYAKADIEEGRVFSLYNGIRRKASRDNAGDKDPNTNFDYRMRLNGDTDIDVPGDWTSLENYCATLGHKANHSFEPNSK